MTVRVTAPMLAAFDHFIGVGFTENGAAAAVGNFCQESGEFLITTMFRPHPDFSGGVPDALKSGGIAEWLGDRKTAYIAFSSRAEARLGLPKGTLLNDLGTQCDFVVYELRTEPSYATLYQQLTSGTRSIANLTANFMMVYERPALATAGLDNRIAHAEAVVARTRLIKAPPVPQPAPPVPIPQGPAPHAPPPIPVSPEAPPAPIPASTAGRRAAEQAHIAAMRAALIAEKTAFNASIDEDIAFFDMMEENFVKLQGVPIAPPPLLQNQAAVPAAIVPQQRTKSMNVVTSNPWTSAGGFTALFGAGMSIYHSISTGTAPDPTQVSTIIMAIGSGIGLLFAKDWNRTGGSVSAVTGVAGAPISLVDKEMPRR